MGDPPFFSTYHLLPSQGISVTFEEIKVKSFLNYSVDGPFQIKTISAMSEYVHKYEKSIKNTYSIPGYEVIVLSGPASSSEAVSWL